MSQQGLSSKNTTVINGPAEDVHKKFNAHFAEFGGWLMPVSYAGTVAEHNAVRTKVGLFDVSHLGKAYVRGAGALEFVNSLLTNDLTKIVPGKAQYTLCTNESGGVVDDLIVYYESDDSLFLVPNAANTADVVALLTAYAHKGNYDLAIDNVHQNYAIFAVQGPLADDVLRDLGVNATMDYMSFIDTDITYQGEVFSVRLCRTGYTGEKGYEIIVPWESASAVLAVLSEVVHAHGGQLAGLGARDTLRTEMGYPLHGHELSLEITPVQARANWAVGWKKPSFLGKEVLVEQKQSGVSRQLYGLKALGKGIPRAGYVVVDSEGNEIGVCTSGTFSPTLETGIALAFLDTSLGLGNGDVVFVDVRGKKLATEVTSLPFVESHVR